MRAPGTWLKIHTEGAERGVQGEYDYFLQSEYKKPFKKEGKQQEKLFKLKTFTFLRLLGMSFQLINVTNYSEIGN